MAKEGLSLVLVDIAPLDSAVVAVKAAGSASPSGKAGEVVTVQCDVSQISQVVALRERVLDQFGEVHLLLNNAGLARPTPAFSLETDLAELQGAWSTVLGTNMMGIINVAQAFAPIMARQENASVIINTGSKQGITTPPGNAGYNVSKAAVKVYTEQRE
jgi:NAD(P)-dependent dehydrogenase (short-subunit alcohol dehydrogenase family)